MTRFAKIPLLVIGIPLLVAVGSLVLGIPSRSQAQGPPAIAVKNAGSPESPEPLIVSETDSPGHIPVQGTFSSIEDEAYLVPADKRLVIEYASGSCVVTGGTGTVVDGDIRTVVNELTWFFNFPSVRSFSPTSIRFASPIHIYADPGTRVSSGGTTTGTASASCGGRFAGYLTNP